MRWLYRFLIRFYPANFRRRFEDEFLSIFDESVLMKQSTAPLLRDVLASLFRHWVLPRTWWLLALCGLLDAIFAGMTFFMVGPDGSLILRDGIYGRTFEHMGMLALAAGACTVVVGAIDIWSSRDRNSWLMVLNGFACGALVLNPVGFQTIALLVVLMALSIGTYELITARTLSCHATNKWLLRAAGAVSVGFADAFCAFAFGWVRLEPRPLADFLWFGSYFGFTAICMLGLAARLHVSPSEVCNWEALRPARNPNTNIKRAVMLKLS